MMSLRWRQTQERRQAREIAAEQDRVRVIMDVAQQEAARFLYCKHERATGDRRWPVLCDKDNRYATRMQCSACKEKRSHAESHL